MYRFYSFLKTIIELKIHIRTTRIHRWDSKILVPSSRTNLFPFERSRTLWIVSLFTFIFLQRRSCDEGALLVTVTSWKYRNEYLRSNHYDWKFIIMFTYIIVKLQPSLNQHTGSCFCSPPVAITMITSWDELISPRLRQLAWSGLKATKALQANKLIFLLDLLQF